MNSFWSDSIRNLEPYIPGEQPEGRELLKLNTNECPYPPSPAALLAIKNAANADLRLYPDPEGTLLKRSVARMYALESGNVFLGNGSDEVLGHIFHALLKHDKPVLFPDITYSFYPVYCALYGIEFEEIPLDEQFLLNVSDYRRDNGGIVVANPNAPTGIALSLEQVRSLLESCPYAVVVVDEAYVDFGAESAARLISEYANLLVVQTLSKSRALAGLRVGYAMGNADLIDALNVVKGCFNSYPLDRLAIAGARAALEDTATFETARRRVVESRGWLTVKLEHLGFRVLPSAANFLFVSHESLQAEELQRQLRERGILVRHFSTPRISNFLRISIGTADGCERLVETLGEIVL